MFKRLFLVITCATSLLTPQATHGAMAFARLKKAMPTIQLTKNYAGAKGLATVLFAAGTAATLATIAVCETAGLWYHSKVNANERLLNQKKREHINLMQPVYINAHTRVNVLSKALISAHQEELPDDADARFAHLKLSRLAREVGEFMGPQPELNLKRAKELEANQEEQEVLQQKIDADKKRRDNLRNFLVEFPLKGWAMLAKGYVGCAIIATIIKKSITKFS